MRLPERTFTALWIGCLLMAMISGSSWADSSGTITGVKVDPDKRTITISTKGQAVKHLARVIGRPNRLVIDFDGAKVGNVPPRIQADSGDIHEIRVGHFNSQARVVLDFQNHPVPPFEVRRTRGQVQVVLSNGAPSDQKAAKSKTTTDIKTQAKGSESELSPSFVPAAAAPKAPDMRAAPPVRSQVASAGPSPRGHRGAPQIEPQPAAANPRLIAQAGELNVPSASFPSRGGSRTGGNDPSDRKNGASGSAQDQANGPRMVREVRPPVTPPTPDPRLLVQEITELKFVQVGHNARLIIRGGDNLDYRLNKLSPTKVKIDLINAEIPKAHQKPLKTDVFSTSVELIVPGSQTIFVQLKDAVPYQVEKKKGVLMVDFPPPRLAITPDQAAQGKPAEGGDAAGREEYKRVQDSRGAQRELARTNRIEQIRKDSENRQARILDLHKEREQLVKKRGEIEKQYEITPDPEVFNKLVTIDFQGISLKNAFRLLAEQAGINIIVSGDLKATTTLKLSQVPLGQVIDTILNTYDLDREIIGNVMRVGPKKDIQGNKEVRQKQKIKLVLDIDKRVQENENRTKDLEKQTETAMKEIEKEEAPEEAPTEDVTKVETIGETEKVMIQGEPVELLLVRVRLSYAKPSKVVSVLDCVFNDKCGAAVASAADAEAQQKLTAQSAAAQNLGLTPDSPTYKKWMDGEQRRTREERLTQAQQTMSAQPARGQATGQASALSPKEAELRTYRRLWPDDDYSTIFIKDQPARIEDMKKLIATLDVPVTQVLIEARVVRAIKNWGRALGIRWGGRNAQQGPVSPGTSSNDCTKLCFNPSRGPTLPFGRRTAIWGITGGAGSAANQPTNVVALPGAADLPSQFVVDLAMPTGPGAPPLGLGMQFGHLMTDHLTDLDVRLQLGEVAGKTKTIHRPKIQVINNETASMKVGQTIPYQTASADGPVTQFKDVPLELNVTPKVFPDGRIQMRLKVMDNVKSGEPSLAAGPIIDIQEASTVMIVKDGDTAVIGGSYKGDSANTKEGWPGLMNVPLLEHLFSNKGKSQGLDELLIFITPTILKRPPPAS